MSKEQINALKILAEHFDWDKFTIKECGLLAWAAFHYYVMRLK